MDTGGRLERRRREREDEGGQSTVSRYPMRWAFLVGIGLMAAAVLGFAVFNLQSVLLSIFIATFVALGLDPLIRWFQRRGLKRGTAIVTVILLFILVVVVIVWIVIPPVVSQAVVLAQSLPGQIANVQDTDWFKNVDDVTNGLATTVLQWIGTTLSDPNFWTSVGSGALAFGAAVLDAVSTGFFVFILSIYFIATLDATKAACYRLVAASHRDNVIGYSERIMASVGHYLSGMVVLAFCNAVYSTILLYAVGVKYALIIGVVALFITLIPLIGTIITTVVMTIVALLVSPTAGIIVLIAMLIYMQVEAYILTPRVMSKAVQVPGSLVLISALAGGTLLGLLGALVAIPISAGILLIIKEVVVPRQAKA
ncbi:AI-2E family transporter [Agromyces seonyuensis]|uniref:AI-2E family transporter n=1 Tax=Agromyces seonyuensis TaxID=2662446 RepID=A0A6I4P3V9_9MICO|nr:AI-2E family transporter [Agromyces seonyuensis]MWB97934.1 AI-2E family transporter [Agromyces seonyuensis]